MLAADMYAIYGVDVFTTGLRPAVIEELVRRLPYEPGSMYRAEELLGGAEWLYWGQTEGVLANMADGQRLQTYATAQQKAKLKEADLYPRPKGKQKQRVRPVATLSGGGMAGVESVLATVLSE